MSGFGRFLGTAFLASVLCVSSVGCDSKKAGEAAPTLYVWGSNSDGQLGLGDDGYFQAVPVSVPGVTGVTQLSVRGAQGSVLRSDGTVRAWGGNSGGEQGIGTTGSFRATPGPVYSAAQTPLANLVGISMGSSHAAAILGGGTLRLWGLNVYGQLGDGTATDRLFATADPGLTNVVEVDAGYVHSLARLSDGTLRAFGRGTSGELGDGATASSSVPVTVRTAAADPTPLAGVVECAVGESHNVARLSDGTLRTWGENGSGQLGDDSTTDRSAAVTPSGLTVVAIAAGKKHTVALLSDGTVRTWGDNDWGQLGDGTTTDRLAPATVLAPDGVSSLSGVVAIGAGTWNTYVVLIDGTVFSCGSNEYGQLGDGTTATRTAPVTVRGSADDPTPLISVIAIAAGNRHSVALLEDGRVVAWGLNDSGQLGDGTTQSRSVPAEIPGLPSIRTIAAGADHTLAIP